MYPKLIFRTETIESEHLLPIALFTHSKALRYAKWTVCLSEQLVVEDMIVIDGQGPIETEAVAGGLRIGILSPLGALNLRQTGRSQDVVIFAYDGSIWRDRVHAVCYASVLHIGPSLTQRMVDGKMSALSKAITQQRRMNESILQIVREEAIALGRGMRELIDFMDRTASLHTHSDRIDNAITTLSSHASRFVALYARSSSSS